MAEDSSNEPLTSLRAGTTDAQAVQTYYDDWADSYDAELDSWHYRAPEDAADLLAPHLAAGQRVLDVGCGTGLLGRALCARAKVSVDGLDISTASLQQAQRRGLYHQLTQHDLQNLPLPVADNAYDIAASIGVLTYIADAGALLRDLCRAVRSGGMIAFTQRTDLWQERRFDDMIARIEGAGLWQRHHISTPKPYLPGNAEFADDIRVIHTLCRVV
ncbi:MAG: class I SAM-dependent methyltransferase [Roseinatronobacter sp.]|nr:MAG: class I SAM-dependent methyltransferase [Roseinatronobacter sp.]